MEGDPPSLWGPAQFFDPCEEPEFCAELARLAGSPLGSLDEQALALAFRRHSLELMRFIPPSRSAEPSFFTLKGDPVAFASATWKVHGPAAAAERMRDLGGLLPEDPLEIGINAERATLVSQRPPLPAGALVSEASPIGAMDTIPIAMLRLEGHELRAEAMSEQRLEQTLEIVAVDFGELVELRTREVTSAEDALAARRTGRLGSTPPRVDPAERLLAGDLVNERMPRWLDEPHQLLAGRTPREAVAGRDRAEVVPPAPPDRERRRAGPPPRRARRRRRAVARRAWTRRRARSLRTASPSLSHLCRPISGTVITEVIT
jgi:hypothetical protein